MTSSSHVVTGDGSEKRAEAGAGAVERPPPSPPGPLGSADEQTLRAAVGANADYYLPRWEAMRSSGSHYNWNWAACFANLYWFAWRKMWRPLAILVVLFLLLGAIGATSPMIGQLTFLVSIGLTFITGAFGNAIYRRHCERLIAASAGMKPEAAKEHLRKGGGTSKIALYVAIGATLLLGTLSVVGQIRQIQADAADRSGRERVEVRFDEA